MAKNDVCHIEWQVTDLSRAQRFFEGMFEWTFQSFGDEMVIFSVGDRHLGGLTKVKTTEPGLSPSIWIETDDIDASVRRAASLGGRAGADRQPVPGVGFSATVRDPDGNTVGLVQFVR